MKGKYFVIANLVFALSFSIFLFRRKLPFEKIQKIENEITIITRTIRTLEPSEKETNKSCEIERVKGWSSSAAGDPTDPHDDIRRNFG